MMTELLTAAQMRAIEAAAIESGEVTGLALMERAGQGVVDAIFAQWPELAPAASGERGPAPSADASPPGYFGQDDGKALRAVVLCGPGNNGGDGFVVARLLKEAGWGVDVFFYGDAEKLPPDARVNYERWCAMGAVRLLHFPDVSDSDCEAFDDAAYFYSGTDLIVDAVFGIGLNRPITGLSPLFGTNDIEVGVGDRLYPARHVAIDLPSGMYSDEPQPPGYLSWFLVDLTVTFHRMKPAHVHKWTKASCGKVVVVDIGVGDD